MTKAEEISREIVTTISSGDVDSMSPEPVSPMLGSGPTERKTRIAVYMRVSDKDLDHDRQIHHIKKWIDLTYPISDVVIYQEKVSGRGGVVRKQLNKLLRDGMAHKYDIAVFWDVDRFGRNVREGLRRIDEFYDMGISVYIAKMNMFWDKDDPVKKMMLQQMLVFAEFESEMIRSRTKEGIEAKVSKLKAFGELNDIDGMRCGTPSILEAWYPDPYKKVNKRGWAVCRDIERENIFKEIWNNPEISSAYKEIEEAIRIPAIPDCLNKCHEFDADGNPVTKTDDEYRKQKCLCNKKPSRKAIHKARVKLDLAPRNIHSFKRKDTYDGIDAYKEALRRIEKEGGDTDED